MLDAPGPTALAIKEVWTHDSPAKARPPGDCSIDVADIHDTLGNEISDLTVERGGEPVGNVFGTSLRPDIHRIRQVLKLLSLYVRRKSRRPPQEADGRIFLRVRCWP